MSVTVRQPLFTDEPRWRQLFAEYLAFYETSLSVDVITQNWNSIIAHPPRINGLVAEAGGEVVGIANFHFQISTWHPGGACYLEDLYVSPAQRGRGVATQLIEAVREAARRQNCGELYWITRSSNVVAQRLYDRMALKTDFIRYEIRDL